MNIQQLFRLWLGKMEERAIRKNMPKKSLPEILTEGSNLADAGTAAKRQATILSMWEEICDAYNHGWSYREIWRGLNREGIIDIGYSTFQHYLRKIKRRLLEAESGIKAVEDAPKPKANQKASMKTIAQVLDTAPAAPLVPGSTRVDIPGLEKSQVSRDQKSFNHMTTRKV